MSQKKSNTKNSNWELYLERTKREPITELPTFESFVGEARTPYAVKERPLTSMTACDLAADILDEGNSSDIKKLLRLLAGLKANYENEILEKGDNIEPVGLILDSMLRFVFSRTREGEAMLNWYLMTQAQCADYLYEAEIPCHCGESLPEPKIFQLQARWNEQTRSFEELHRFDVRATAQT